MYVVHLLNILFSILFRGQLSNREDQERLVGILVFNLMVSLKRKSWLCQLGTKTWESKLLLYIFRLFNWNCGAMPSSSRRKLSLKAYFHSAENVA